MADRLPIAVHGADESGPVAASAAGARRSAARSRVRPPSEPRTLHPVAWWVWGLGLMVAASRTTNPGLLATLLAAVWFVVDARREAAPWAASFRAALRLGAFIIAGRTVLQVVLAPPVGFDVAFTLPSLALPEAFAGVRFGGPVTWASIVVGLTEGARLAVMVACVGAANALVAPSRLLRSVPGALYELGVAVTVALTFAPQLVVDAGRIRTARLLRGHRESALRAWARTVGPVLDGALERSVRLAAAMDTRGYGRTVADDRARPRAGVGPDALLSLGGAAGLVIGLYGLFDATGAGGGRRSLAVLAVGAGLTAVSLHQLGRRSQRSTYRADPWTAAETATALSGVAAAIAFWIVPDALLAMPVTPLEAPALPPLAIAAVLLAAGPAAWTPLPARPAQPAAARRAPAPAAGGAA